ncbi:gag-pol polyprotein [Tanacetum coccineum]
MEEGKFLGYVVTNEGIKVDPEKVKVVLQSPIPRGPDQIRNLSLQLMNISRFIPKLAKFMLPIRNIRMSLDVVETSNWTSEAEEAFQNIKRRLGKLQTLVVLKEGEFLVICLWPRSETIIYVQFVKRNEVQIPISYVSRPLQGIETCYTPTEKAMLTLIHTMRSIRIIFRRYKVKVVTDGPMEEMLKISSTNGRFAKWAAELRTYHVSYIQRKEADGQVVKKFFGQAEQVLHVSNKNGEGASGSREKP